MIQSFPHWVSVTNGSGTRFWCTPTSQNNPQISAGVLCPIPAAGTIKNLRVRSKSTIPSGGTSTTTVWINGSSSALSVALNNSTQEGTDTDTVSVSAGDTLEFRCVTNTSAGAHTLEVSIDFEPTDADVSCVFYGGLGDSIGSSGATTGLFYSGGAGGWNGHSGDGDRAAVPGTITNHYVRGSAAPGNGNSRTFTIYKNGPAQDGTGGTPDTRITLSGAGSGSGVTFGSTSFSLSVSEHDELRVVHTTTGTPSTTQTVAGGCRFASSTAGAYNVGAFVEGAPSASATEYAWPFGRQYDGVAWSSTEDPKEFKLGPTTLVLGKMRVDIDVAPGTGDSWTFTLRKNNAATGLTVTISDSSTTATVTSTVTLSDGDNFCFESDPTGTPAAPSGIRLTFGPEPPFVMAPGAGSLVFTGYAPALLTGGALTPAEGALVLSGHVPVLQHGLYPDAGALVLQGLAPLVSAGAIAFPAEGVLLLQGYAPTVSEGGGGGGSVTVSPGAGSLLLVGYGPVLDHGFYPAAGFLTLSGYSPLIEFRPEAGALTLQGWAPEAYQVTPVATPPLQRAAYVLFSRDIVEKQIQTRLTNTYLMLLAADPPPAPAPSAPTLVSITGNLYDQLGNTITSGRLVIAPLGPISANSQLVSPSTVYYTITGPVSMSLVPSNGVLYKVEYDSDPNDVETPVNLKTGYWTDFWDVPATGPVDVSDLGS